MFVHRDIIASTVNASFLRLPYLSREYLSIEFMIMPSALVYVLSIVVKIRKQHFLQSTMVGDIVQDYGGSNFKWATSPETRKELWSARHSAYWAALQWRPGSQGLTTDVCVPISHLTECIMESKEDVK